MKTSATGIAIAAACADCAHLIGDPPETDGIRMTIVCDHHIPELYGLGWIITRYDDEPPDVVCPHYHEANWIGGPR